MRKYLFLLLAISIANLSVMAGNVSEAEAFQKAQRFMQGKQWVMSPQRLKAKGMHRADTVRHGYYIFNTVENNGFVIMASDDRLPEVLGYSERGNLNIATAPCNVKWLLEYYDKVAATIKTGFEVQPTRRAAKADIRPIITTTWDQGAPYNDLCPENNGAHCLTGCVATAMAQVINYNRWPEGETSGVAAYTTASSQISVPALEPTTFDWDNMTNSDIARLMRYCGQSVRMDYGVDGSGAFPIDEAPALIRVFGYSQSTHYAEHVNYSEAEWEDLLYNELAEQRPIVFNGFGSTGGHTFVVHGYRNGRFYINWGWSGSEDGYFYLTGLNTSTGDYSSDQSATIGIQPPAGVDISRPKVAVKRLYYYGVEKYSFRDENQGFSFYVNGSLVSDLAERKTLSIGLGLYDASGLKKVLWETRHDFPVGEEYEFDTNVHIDGDVADGEYRIVPICRSDDNDIWRADANSSDYYLTATISGNYLKLLTYPLSSEERSITDLGIETIDGITYLFYEQKGKQRAQVFPGETGAYRGELYVPDQVSYQGSDFKVASTAFTAFKDCHELTSLSLGITTIPIIWGCEKLTKLELREGVVEIGQIGGCTQLESIEFPKTLAFFEFPITWCYNLKTIRFKGTGPLTFSGMPEWYDEAMPRLTDVYFESPDAPQLRNPDNSNPPHTKATIHVPQGCKADYETAGWSGWNLVDDGTEVVKDGIEWSYCEDNTVNLYSGVYDSVGGNDAEYAIHVPANMLEAYKGKTISSIQVFMATDYDYVFITKPGTDYLVKQDAADVTGTWVSIALPEPYTITGDELFVGVGRKGAIQMPFSDENIIEKDGFWFRTMGADNSQYEPGEWINVAEQNEQFAHPLPIRFVITGDDLPADVLLKDVAMTPIDKGHYTITAKAVNRLPRQLKSFTVDYDFNGSDKVSKSFDVDVRPGRVATISFDVQATLTNRNNDFNYAVTTANGQQDAIAANSTGAVNFNIPANTYYPRVVVMEEATGTWCGWCVRGIESIERLREQYPANFIAIGLHNSDDMANFVNYGVIAKRFNSYPSCLINRTQLMDPSFPLVQPIVEAMKDKAEAKISATSTYAKRDLSAITVNTESIFGFTDDKTADFRLSYALIEDHVGPYVQNNYYSGMTVDGDDAYMEKWTKEKSRVKIEFNDVARGLFGGPDGVEGSVPKAVVEGQSYKYAYTFALPDNIANRENLRVVVMMIDQKSGEIINACETKVTYDSSIENQVFSFVNNGESILDGTTVTYASEINDNGIAGNCGTNTEAGKSGLTIRTYDNSVQEGTAKLEILSNSLEAQRLTWTMGGTEESVLGKTVVEKTFRMNNRQELAIGLTAAAMQAYGQLEARLTVTMGSQTESVNIVLLNEKPVVGNVTVGSDQVWWCNHDTRDADEGGLGTGLAEHYMVAIHIPFDLLGGAGTTIDGFSFRSAGSSTANAAVWVSAKLPDSDDMVDLECIRIPAKQLREFQWHEVAFSQSYEIPADGLYVGYSFDITDTSVPGGSYPITYTTSDRNRKGGLWVKTDGNPKWIDFGMRYGNVLAKVLFGGGTFKYNAVSTTDMATVVTLTGQTATGKMHLVNEGADIVNSLTMETKGSDGTVKTSTINTHIEPYSENIIDFSLTGDIVANADTKTVTITKVNGRDNAPAGSKSAQVRLFTLSQRPTYTPVFEEVASTTFWGSIRVPFVSKELEKTFGSQIIQLYPHVSDIMKTEDYSELTDSLKILRMYVNRDEIVDNYYGTNWQQWGIKDYIRQTLNTVAPGSINVSAAWTDDEQTQLEIRTETNFEVSFDDNPFLIGFVVVEDGLHGTGSQWEQANQYAGEDFNSEPFFSEMAALPAWVPNLQFDNIPVAAWGAHKGVTGTLPTTIVGGQNNVSTFSTDLSGNMLIQEKDNLSVVALLLDKKSGKIMNAAKVRMKEKEGTDIMTISVEHPVDVYDIRGHKVRDKATTLDGLAKGIYIVRGRKVVVK